MSRKSCALSDSNTSQKHEKSSISVKDDSVLPVGYSFSYTKDANYTENDKAAYSSLIRREDLSPGKYSESLNFDERASQIYKQNPVRIKPVP